MIDSGSKSDGFFSKYLYVTRYFSCSQLRESSQQARLWYHFIFKVNFEEDLLPRKFFLSVASSEALMNKRCSLKYGTSIRRFSFKIVVLNISVKSLEKASATELIFSTAISCEYVLCVNDFLGFSWKFSEQLFQKTKLARRLLWFCLIIS